MSNGCQPRHTQSQPGGPLPHFAGVPFEVAPPGAADVTLELGPLGCRPSVIKPNVCGIEALRARAPWWRRRPDQAVMLARVRRTHGVSGALLLALILATEFSTPLTAC